MDDVGVQPAGHVEERAPHHETQKPLPAAGTRSQGQAALLPSQILNSRTPEKASVSPKSQRSKKLTPPSPQKVVHFRVEKLATEGAADPMSQSLTAR
jgi:hypothetical protein